MKLKFVLTLKPGTSTVQYRSLLGPIARMYLCLFSLFATRNCPYFTGSAFKVSMKSCNFYSSVNNENLDTHN